MNILRLFLFCFFVISCSGEKKADTVMVNVSFDEESKSAYFSSDKFDSTDPTNVYGFNCYGVMVTYPELISPVTCYNYVDTASVMARPNKMVGLVNFPEGIIATEVKIGGARRFQVVAFNVDKSYTGGVCPNHFSDWTAFKDHMSYPFLIGEVTRNIEPIGEMNIDMIVSYSATSADDMKIDRCVGLANLAEDIFKPTHIAGLKVWLDASNADFLRQNNDGTLTVANSDIVGRWYDKSGNGVTVTATTGDRPVFETNSINTKGSLYFSSGNHMETSLFPSSPTGTTFIVFKPSDIATDQKIFATKDSTNTTSWGILSSKLRSSVGGGAAVDSSTTLAVSNVYLVTSTYDVSGSVDIYINGTFENNITAGTVSSQNFYVGALNNDGTVADKLNGRIGEILFYDSVLDVSNRDKVHNYLTLKWGL